MAASVCGAGHAENGNDSDEIKLTAGTTKRSRSFLLRVWPRAAFRKRIAFDSTAMQISKAGFNLSINLVKL